MGYKFATSTDGNKYPRDWATERLRFLAKVNPVKSEVAHLPDDTSVSFVAMESVGERGEMHVEIEKPIADVYGGYTYFVEGDIVIAKITPCFENGKAAIARGLINGVGFGTTELHVIRPSDRIDPRWFFYLASSYHFRELGTARMYGAGGQKRVPEDFLKDFIIAVPTSTEQQQIADFLDWKTGQVDRLIAKKRALVSALSEKRMAVITQAVTRGLDPTLPMKQSGIAWLGMVPKHWEVGGYTKFVEHRADYRGRTPEKVPDGVFLVTARNIKQGQIDYSLSQEFVAEEDYDAIMSRGLPRIGDLLFTTEAPLGEVANVDRTDIALAQRIIKFRGEPAKLNDFFVKYWMMSTPFQNDLRSLATGSTALGIKASKLFALRCVVPPIMEQAEIVNFLDSEDVKWKRLSQKIEQAIDRLTEYRTALITAATTGKIDVRDVEIPGQSR